MASGAGAAAARDSIVPGEYVMTTEDFRRITAMLHADSGITMNETKAALVYSRLAKRLRALGLENFRAYCKLVSGAEGLDERQRMLSALTTNLTRFFREAHHFEHLKTKVLPPLIAGLKQGGRVRLWSAGCSNGAEPYSMAMTLLAVMPDALDHDVRILASDIDPVMVENGRRAVYETDQLRDAPRELVERWMVPVRNGARKGFGAGEAMRELVAFRELNLIGAWPMKGGFDAIFCRNVAIYFDEATQAEIWRRFTTVLAPGAPLYIGHSERVAGDAAACLRTDGVTTYRMAGART